MVKFVSFVYMTKDVKSVLLYPVKILNDPKTFFRSTAFFFQLYSVSIYYFSFGHDASDVIENVK